MMAIDQTNVGEAAQLGIQAQGILQSVETTAAGLVGLSAIVTDHALFLSKAILEKEIIEIKADDWIIDGRRVYGIALSPKARERRRSQLHVLGKRLLLCDSLEVVADHLARMARITSVGADPYAQDDYFSVDIRELWNQGPGRAGSLLDPEDRQFIEKCLAPIRNFMRHNNSTIPPLKSIHYEGSPKGVQISVHLEWQQGSENQIRVSLSQAYKLFHALQAALAGAIKRLQQSS